VHAAMQEMVDEAFDELWATLEAEPAKVMPVLAFAKKSPAEMCPRTVSDEDAPYHDTYRKLWRYPKEYAQQYLLDVPKYARAEIDLPMLKLPEKGEDDICRRLWYFAHDCDGTAPWPRFAHSKAVFKRAFSLMYESYGRRLDTLILDTTGDKVKVDWRSWGAFVFLPIDKYPKTHVMHVSGQKAELIGSGFSIDGSAGFTITDTWHTIKAEVRYKKSSVKIIELFSEEFQRAQKQRAARVRERMQVFANQAQSEVGEDPGDEDASPSKKAKLTVEALAAGVSQSPPPPPRAKSKAASKKAAK